MSIKTDYKLDNKTKAEELRSLKKIFSELSLMCPFTYPLLSWPVVFTTADGPIAAINGVSIFINLEKWKKLKNSEKLFVVLHEWLHVVLMHIKRARTRNGKTYNYACDFVINGMIHKDFKNLDLPHGLYDPIYDRKSSEEVFKDLDDEVRRRQMEKIDPFCHVCNRKFNNETDVYCNHDEEPKCPACFRKLDQPLEDSPKYCDREAAINQLMMEKCGTPWGNDLLPLPGDANIEDLLDKIIKAAERHKMMRPGTLPGDLIDHIEELKKSEVPFERLLIRFAKQALNSGNDRNPFKPQTKYLKYDIFIPQEFSNKIRKVVLIADTSGSMDSVEFEYVAGHLQKLHSICDVMYLITADTVVHEEVKVKNIKHDLKSKKIQFKGRGGTDMHEAFERAGALRPDLIILYSDMMIGSYPKRPHCPVIFLARESWAKSAEKPPYGAFIVVKDIEDYE